MPGVSTTHTSTPGGFSMKGCWQLGILSANQKWRHAFGQEMDKREDQSFERGTRKAYQMWWIVHCGEPRGKGHTSVAVAILGAIPSWLPCLSSVDRHPFVVSKPRGTSLCWRCTFTMAWSCSCSPSVSWCSCATYLVFDECPPWAGWEATKAGVSRHPKASVHKPAWPPPLCPIVFSLSQSPFIPPTHLRTPQKALLSPTVFHQILVPHLPAFTEKWRKIYRI